MRKVSLWLIVPKTNLHVGSDNIAGYGIIDKPIQRDVVTHLPAIYSSSLKGALSEYAASEGSGLSGSQNLHIFGSDKTGKEKGTQKGHYIFYDANILFIPRQDDEEYYHLVTCNEVIKHCVKRAELMNFPLSECYLREKANEICCPKTLKEEDYKGEFAELCSEQELPIIARNVIENGESKNLWYEQVVPRESAFYTFIEADNDDLENAINGKIIQIGANATIGYGYCKFIKVSTMNRKRYEILLDIAETVLADKNCELFRGGKAVSAYNGKIAAFGVSIAMNGVLPTLANYYQKDYKVILDVLAKMMNQLPEGIYNFSDKEGLLKFANNLDEQSGKVLRGNLQDCSIALKSIFRTYPEE